MKKEHIEHIKLFIYIGLNIKTKKRKTCCNVLK